MDIKSTHRRRAVHHEAVRPEHDSGSEDASRVELARVDTAEVEKFYNIARGTLTGDEGTDFDIGKHINLMDHIPKKYFEVPELSTDPLENIPQEFFEFDVEKYMDAEKKKQEEDANFDKNKYLQSVTESIPEEYFAVPWDAVKPPDPYAEPDL